MHTAARLAVLLDDLASSLARSGTPPAEAQRLLETASLATLQAVSLDLLTGARTAPDPAEQVGPGSSAAKPAAASARLAA